MRKLGVLGSVVSLLVAFVRELPVGTFAGAGSSSTDVLSFGMATAGGLTFYAWGVVDATGSAWTPLSGPGLESLAGLFVWVLPVVAGCVGLAASFPGGGGGASPTNGGASGSGGRRHVLLLAGLLCVLELSVFTLLSVFAAGRPSLGFYLLAAAAVAFFAADRLATHAAS
ncbi:MAG: hypothetical protein ACTSU5_13645 [Promethearchaeota archaeon]